MSCLTWGDYYKLMAIPLLHFVWLAVAINDSKHFLYSYKPDVILCDISYVHAAISSLIG